MTYPSKTAHLSSVPYFDGLPSIVGTTMENLYRVHIHADMIKIHATNAVSPSGDIPKRGNVSEFSHKSRKRMIEALASEMRVPDLFITLTWSDDTYSPCMDTYRAHFEAFRRRLERAYGTIDAIWRVEIERRKSGDYKGLHMPHLHLLVFLPEGINAQLIVDKDNEHNWAEWWHDITGSTHPEHLERRGCDIQQIKSRRHGYHYVSKYAAKQSEDNLAIGRRWGMIGQVGQGSLYETELTRREYIELKRLIVTYQKKRKKWIGKKLARQSVALGLTGFGLGVFHAPDHSLPQSTIYRMIIHAKELASEYEEHHNEQQSQDVPSNGNSPRRTAIGISAR